jgi:hypothetical protein
MMKKQTTHHESAKIGKHKRISLAEAQRTQRKRKNRKSVSSVYSQNDTSLSVLGGSVRGDLS